jgi:E3 ubiquitin-protein ligase CCNP1IP1
MEPRFVLEASSRAIEFWNFQKELEVNLMQKEAKELRFKYQQAERAAEEKIQALQAQQRLLNDQLEALRQERDKHQREIAEITEKYNSKARQKRKLEELYTTLKQAGDAAKRATSPLNSRARVSSPQVPSRAAPLAIPRAEPSRPSLSLQSVSGTHSESLDSQ